MRPFAVSNAINSESNTMNPRETDDTCPGCGSSLKDREQKAKRYPNDNVPTGFTTCEFCGSSKCCMCDMGDDVECPSCED